MPVEIHCPCGKRLLLSTAAAGGQGRCPACGRVLDIPIPEPGTPSAVAPPLPADSSTAVTEDPTGAGAERAAVTEAAPPALAGESLTDLADDIAAADRPDYRLASPGQVGWAAFLGGPLGGFFLIARNYAKCGRTAACWVAVAAGVAVTAVPITISSALPDMHPALNFGVALPLWLGTYMTAKLLQERTFETHRRRGGQQVSGWVVFGFILLGVVLTLGPVVGGAVLYDSAFGDQELHFTDKEVIFYGRDVPEAEARTLGRVLREGGLFNGVGEKSVRLHKDGPDYVLSVVLLFGFDDPQIHQEFRDLARNLSAALGGKTVRVELCDTWETPKKKLAPERAP